MKNAIIIEARSPEAMEAIKEFSKNRNMLSKITLKENKLYILPRGVARLAMRAADPEILKSGYQKQIDEVIKEKGLDPEDLVLVVA